jgi:hypothetical protein
MTDKRRNHAATKRDGEHLLTEREFDLVGEVLPEWEAIPGEHTLFR